MPQDFLHDLDDPDKANAFLRDTAWQNTTENNRGSARSQLFLAYKTKLAGEALADSVRALATAIEHAFADHAKALREAANASDKHATGLNRATWALVIATAALVIAQAVTIYVMVTAGQ